MINIPGQRIEYHRTLLTVSGRGRASQAFCSLMVQSDIK